jgi:hypothetical protein
MGITLKWKWTKPETRGALTAGLLLLVVLAVFLLFSKLQEVDREYTVLVLESYPHELQSQVEVLFDGEKIKEDTLVIEPGTSPLVSESLTVPNKYLGRDSLLVEIGLHNGGNYTVHFSLRREVGS